MTVLIEVGFYGQTPTNNEGLNLPPLRKREDRSDFNKDGECYG
jgi:hypothetical protein